MEKKNTDYLNGFCAGYEQGRLWAQANIKENITFAAAADLWQQEYVSFLERGTQQTYQSYVSVALERFGSVDVLEIKTADIYKLMLELKRQGRRYDYAQQLRSILCLIFDHAINSGYALSNPARAAQIPPGMAASQKKKAPTEYQESMVLSNLHQPFGLFAAILYYTGLRTEEAVALTWGDVDYRHRVIHVTKAVDLHGAPVLKAPKTENGIRNVPIVDPLLPYLRRPPDAKPDTLIFARNGKLLTRSQITSQWIGWCKAAGLAELKTYSNRHRNGKECVRNEWRPTITPHQLRHLYATICVEAGIGDIVLQEWMGHADVRTTKGIYAEVRQSYRSAQTAIINAHFATQSAAGWN